MSRELIGGFKYDLTPGDLLQGYFLKMGVGDVGSRSGQAGPGPMEWETVAGAVPRLRAQRALVSEEASPPASLRVVRPGCSQASPGGNWMLAPPSRLGLGQTPERTVEESGRSSLPGA